MFKNKYIESPDKMWEYFTKYVAYSKANPITVHDFVGKDGDSVRREKERPLTLEGFEDWLFEEKIINDIGDYMSNKDGRYSDYAAICRAIKRKVRKDQIEGGMAGIYNPSITQRLNGLVEKVQEDGKKELTIKVNYGKRDNAQRPASESNQDDAGGEEV
jgi:hypothetical protein